jgi:shikimate dehydrogenase
MTHLPVSTPWISPSATAQDIAPVGLIGYPVEHSLSPAMHNAAFEQLGLPYHYVLLPTSPGQLGERVLRCVEQGFAGWNVTVPHKTDILTYLDKMSDEVRATGACNTVRIEAGSLSGFNTDSTGFMAGLEEAGGIAPGSRAVLLGAGGAARGVAWALSRAGHEVCILARRPEQASALAEALSAGTPSPVQQATLDAPTLSRALDGVSLLVNCTQAGMWPHDDATPIPAGVRLPGGILVYDLVYIPRPTRLLRESSMAGCRTQDGLAMLVHQGAAAFEIWTGMPAPVEAMRQACLDALSDRKQVTKL